MNMKKHKKFLLNSNGKKYKANTLVGLLWNYLAGKTS